MERATKRVQWWIHYVHWIEGVGMLLTGPFLMLYPELVLTLYGLQQPHITSIDILPWFGALVTLMGYFETFSWRVLPKRWIEACLLADILWLYCFVKFVNVHGLWNIWTFFASAAWPMVYAPLRMYWLWGVEEKYKPYD